MRKYVTSTESVEQELESIEATERLENGSLKFLESILIKETPSLEEQEKKRQRLLEEINHKYRD